MHRASILVLILTLAASTARADMVTLTPIKDNTLYNSATGALSNGAGEHIHAGRTGVGGPGVVRGVLAFDVAAAVPAGATINSVTLVLNLSMANPGAQTIRLHRLLADWGEGTSDAPQGEGQGALSTTGDATWIHRFFDTTFWTTAGGDFVAAPSESIGADAIGLYTFGTTPDMVADVQGWLDNPAASFGWIVRGNEATASTAKRFDSKDNLVASVRPKLNIDYTPAVVSQAAGRIPNDDDVPGVPLILDKAAGGMLLLEWGASCTASDNDYAIYEGTLDDFTSHTSLLCSTGGVTGQAIAPAAVSSYYLVVPRNANREGSYGKNSADLERPQGVAACLTQEIGACP